MPIRSRFAIMLATVCVLVSTSTFAAAQITDNSKLYRAFENFITQAYLKDWFANAEVIQRHYAPRMRNYWGKRNASLRTVLGDKQGYAQRWPNRIFQFIEDSLVVVPTDEDDVYRVRFNYRYNVRGEGRQSAGIGETELTVSLSNSRVTILAEGGRVLRRF